MEIRETNFAQCCEVHNQIPEFDKRELEVFKQRLEGHTHLALVSYQDKKVISGFALAYDLNRETFYLWLAGVLPESRKLGSLQMLIDYIESWCRQKSYRRLHIKSMNQFKPMLHFLLKNNFDIIGVGDDAKILFEKIL